MPSKYIQHGVVSLCLHFCSMVRAHYNDKIISHKLLHIQPTKLCLLYICEHTSTLHTRQTYGAFYMGTDKAQDQVVFVL